MSEVVRARPGVQSVAVVVRVVGAGLLAATGAIHLHLYEAGYRTITTIGPLFLLNTVVGIAGAVALLAAPRRWLPWVAAGGGLFEAGSLAALVLSLTVGLFGFVETTRAPFAGTTIIVESAGAVVLLGYAAPVLQQQLRARRRR